MKYCLLKVVNSLNREFATFLCAHCGARLRKAEIVKKEVLKAAVRLLLVIRIM